MANDLFFICSWNIYIYIIKIHTHSELSHYHAYRLAFTIQLAIISFLVQCVDALHPHIQIFFIQ